MKITFITTIVFLFFTLKSLVSLGQDEREIMVFLTRICTNDSIKKTIGLAPTEGDSLTNFFFSPITNSDTIVVLKEEDLPLYEYDKYRVTFENHKKLIATKTPYASIRIMSYSPTKCVLLVELQNLENRSENGLWQHAFFNLDLSKGGRWYLTSVNYENSVYKEPVIEEVTKKSKKK